MTPPPLSPFRERVHSGRNHTLIHFKSCSSTFANANTTNVEAFNKTISTLLLISKLAKICFLKKVVTERTRQGRRKMQTCGELAMEVIMIFSR